MQLEVNLVHYPAGITVKLPKPIKYDPLVKLFKHELEEMRRRQVAQWYGFIDNLEFKDDIKLIDSTETNMRFAYTTEWAWP